MCEDRPLHCPWVIEPQTRSAHPLHLQCTSHGRRVSVCCTHVLEQIAWSSCLNEACNTEFCPSRTILWETDSGLTFPDLQCSGKVLRGCFSHNQLRFRTQWPLQRVPREWAQGQEPASELGNVGWEGHGQGQARGRAQPGAKCSHSPGPGTEQEARLKGILILGEILVLNFQLKGSSVLRKEFWRMIHFAHVAVAHLQSNISFL